MRDFRFSNGMDASEMKHYLDFLSNKFNNRSFIFNDPVSIPHRYKDRHDIEIAGFFAATIAWGRRDLILRSANILLEMMGNEPYRFTTQASDKEMSSLAKFVHRTFNGDDAITFIHCLRNIYTGHGSMEDILLEAGTPETCLKDSLIHLHKVFFSVPHRPGSERHLSDISKGSAGKKLNMFIRWMVRNDDAGVDFGLWNRISPSLLYIPLDLHAGNTARRLGLLTRKQNDWKAVEELTSVLREFDPEDPVKYDFALFGAGVNREM